MASYNASSPVAQYSQDEMKQWVGYSEPPFGLPFCKSKYKISFLIKKEDTIIGEIPLNSRNEEEIANLQECNPNFVSNYDNRSYWSFGREYYCDHVMFHPSTSRVHCIVQFGDINKFNKYSTNSDSTNRNKNRNRNINEEKEIENEYGIYLLDRSTHGTFVSDDNGSNWIKIVNGKYTQISINDRIVFGGSTRYYQLKYENIDVENIEKTDKITTKCKDDDESNKTAASTDNNRNKNKIENNRNVNYYRNSGLTGFVKSTINDSNTNSNSNSNSNTTNTTQNTTQNTINRYKMMGFAKSSLKEDNYSVSSNNINSINSNNDDDGSDEPLAKRRRIEHSNTNNASHENENKKEKTVFKSKIRQNFEKKLQEAKSTTSEFSLFRGKEGKEKEIEQHFYQSHNQAIRPRKF